MGRRLSFDRDAALRRAMLLFWRHGYEGTSVHDLTVALGVTPPSIYTAFGDKKRLFREAVALYLAPAPDAIEAPTARAAARAMLVGAAEHFTGEATPPGCLLATSAISGSPASADVQAELARIRRDFEAVLRRRIEAAVASGELPAGTDASALAGLTMAVTQGLSTLARDGATRDALLAIAETAMQAWPPQPADAQSTGRPSITSPISRS